jgi:Peptidase M15
VSDGPAFVGDVNLYVCLANNPIVLIDPFGLKVNWGRYKVGNPELQRRLELLSAQIGFDIDVTGGDRTEEENDKLGGAKDSRQLIGGAVNFHLQGRSSPQAYTKMTASMVGPAPASPARAGVARQLTRVTRSPLWSASSASADRGCTLTDRRSSAQDRSQ